MKTYTVIAASASFMSGVLKLTGDQYKAREHALKPLGNGLYQVIQQTGFKKGETVGYEGKVNKTLLQDITPVEEPAPSTSILDLLDLKADEIKDLLSDSSITVDDLAALSQAEAEGKNRKSVIKAIEDELSARKAAAEEAAEEETDKELFE